VKRGWVLVLVLAVAACERKPASTPPTNAPPAPVTVEQLRNAEYPSEWSESRRVRLVDGQFHEAPAPGSVTEIVVRATGHYALGDLDGDGVGDGVVVLESDPGGSGVFFDLVPVVSRGGAAVPLKPTPLGDRVDIKDVTLSDGEVSVHLVKHGPDDPQCCPTLEVTLRYRLQGDTLVVEGQEASRNSASPVTRNVVHSLMARAPMFS
jgi:hypothetical protein